MQLIKYILSFLCFISFNILQAQNYQAINGSSYAGSLSTNNNPSSIVHVPYAWDITPISVQSKQSTNFFKIDKYSLLSSFNNAEISAQNGERNRYLYTSQDIRLFNTRISLNSRAAIAFGVNIKSFGYATTSKVNVQDSSQSLRDFLDINRNNSPLSAESVVSTWGELYGTYAQTIMEDNGKLLNIGLTLKINRAIGGGYGKANKLGYSALSASSPGYIVNSGSLEYGYSYNFDKIDSNKSTLTNAQKFLLSTNSGFSADVGIEYIIQPDNENRESSEYAYNTKIGISVMDIGNNKYSYGKYSSFATAGKAGTTDTLIENKFVAVNSVGGFTDSLASIANSFNQLEGNFTVYQPTRLIVNVDQHISNNFFINTQLTIPILSLFSTKLLYIKDINLLAITPRWEIKALGAYLPILYNNRNQLWVGAAFKAGPILLGTHNLANLFSKNKMQVGGFYLALTIRPSKIYERAAHYPNNKSSLRQIKNLGCPKF